MESLQLTGSDNWNSEISEKAQVNGIHCRQRELPLTKVNYFHNKRRKEKMDEGVREIWDNSHLIAFVFSEIWDKVI